MNKKKQEFEKTNTINIAGTESWNNWYNERVPTKELWLMTSLLLKSNAKDFKSIFGNQDFCTLDSANRRLWVWKQELPSGSIWLITDNKERGTSYEVTKDVSWADQELFFNKLMSDLKKLGSE